MAQAVRAYPWAQTVLGPLDTWPEALVAVVNLALCSPIPTTVHCGKDMLMVYNDAYRIILGHRHPDALGHAARMVWAEAWQHVGPQFEAAFRQGAATFEQDVLIPIVKDGNLQDSFWIMTLSPVFDGGNIVAVYNPCFETTEGVLTQRRLRASETQATRILQSIGDAVIVTDAAGRIMRMNPVAETLTAWTAGDALGEQLSDVFHIVNESTRQRVESPADKVRRTGRIVGLANHTVLIARDGTEVSIDDSGAPIRDAEGRLSGVVLVFRDIAERRSSERDMAQVARRQAVLVDLFNTQRNSNDPAELMTIACDLIARKFAVDRVGFYTVTPSGQMLYANGRADGFLPLLQGGEPAEWMGLELTTLATSGTTIAIDDTGTDPLTAGTGFMERGIRACLDGPFVRDGRWVGGLYVHHAQPRSWSSNDVYFFRQVADSTWAAVERLRTLHALRISEERFRTTFNNAPVGIAVSRLDRTLVDFNVEFERLTGQNRADLLGEDFLLLSPPEDSQEHRETYRDLCDGKIASVEVEKRYLHPDGTAHWVRANSTVVRDDDGRPELILGIIEDIEIRRKTEAALIQNEKLAAVGRLAASIAHEINNPLESVTNLMYLARHSQALPEAQEYLDVAERELRRVSAITNQTLRFHRQSTAPTPTFCSDLFSDTLSIYQGRLVNSRILVSKRKRAERAVNCLSGEVRQVLSNLIGNAIDSMASGGTLFVRSREASNWRTGAQGIVLTVADTGTGMTAEVQNKIFDAFFTTKGIGGTGLGLWISAEIVARHRGSLRVRSSQAPAHHGTVFALFLPFDGFSL